MMVLGVTFGDELFAAGLGGLPISWGSNGSIEGRQNLTPEQNAALDAVIEAHDPDAQPAENYRRAIQHHLDGTAQSRGYDSALSIASYVASTVPTWAAEAQAFVAWRDAVWAYALTELAKVQAAEREQPTIEALIGELPEIEWPH